MKILALPVLAAALLAFTAPAAFAGGCFGSQTTEKPEETKVETETS
ncbi:MAG: hypothetical protein ACFBWO_10145 [Paracoccaceae bacterium]